MKKIIQIQIVLLLSAWICQNNLKDKHSGYYQSPGSNCTKIDKNMGTVIPNSRYIT